MTPSPFALQEEEIIDLAASVMDWRRIRHVPVEDASHRFLGLVTYRSLLRTLFSRDGMTNPLIAVREAMVTDVETVTPETGALETLDKMREHDVGCLPVVQEGQLVGIVSERDLMPLARRALEAPESITSTGPDFS